MSFRWMAILILVLVLGISFVALKNPSPAPMYLPLIGAKTPTSGLLMILAFAAGVVCSIVFFAVRDWQDYFRKLAGQKQEKLARAARERYHRARTYLELGQRDLALAALREAVEKDPASAEAHALLGDLLAEKGDHFGATTSHAQAVTLDRDDGALPWKLCRDYLRAGNQPLAMATMKEALDLHDRSLYLLVRYRDLLVEMKDWDAAIAAQQRLSKLREYRGHEDPRLQLAGLFYQKGQDLLATGRPEEAGKAFEEAVRLDQQLALAYVRGGDAALAAGKEKNALKIWALGYRRTSDPAILSRLEEYYLRANDPSRIINLYLRHIDERPEDALLRLQFAELLFKLEMLQEAQGQLDEVRRLAGDDIPAAAGLAWRLREKMEDCPGALAELKSLVNGRPPAVRHVCSACQAESPEAAERCPACGRWGSLRRAI